MTYSINGMTMAGFENEEQARKMAPEIMEEALAAGYDPTKKPFMCEVGEEDDVEDPKKPEA